LKPNQKFSFKQLKKYFKQLDQRRFSEMIKFFKYIGFLKRFGQMYKCLNHQIKEEIQYKMEVKEE
jgi:hypothetical protein